MRTLSRRRRHPVAITTHRDNRWSVVSAGAGWGFEVVTPTVEPVVNGDDDPRAYLSGRGSPPEVLRDVTSVCKVDVKRRVRVAFEAVGVVVMCPIVRRSQGPGVEKTGACGGREAVALSVEEWPRSRW